jgi:hypothetical protein
MERIIRDGKVDFVCSCGGAVTGSGADRLINVEGAKRAEAIDKYKIMLDNVAFSPTGLRVDCQCDECGLTYMSQVRVGDEETIVRVCKCGARKLV